MYGERNRMERRYKRRGSRRRGLRLLSGCVGVLILVMSWNLTSFALRRLLPEELPGRTGLEEPQETLKEAAETRQASEAPEKEKLLLVNKEHKLPDTYRPSLKKLKSYGVEVDQSIFTALDRMLKAGEQEGLSFWVASGYRSPKRQQELLDEDISALLKQGYSYAEAYEEVTKETMPAGYSEHATGLCVDVVAKDYQLLDEKQGETAEMKWLQENCSQYGFILRYPEGKEDITKVSYESWHYRYVGTEAAREIMERGITLEEYLESE